MEINIYAGQRVLYKHGGQWHVGELTNLMPPAITSKGLFLFVIPKEYIGYEGDKVPYLHDVEINELFLDATPTEDYWRDYNDIFMTKEDYINMIENDEDFVKSAEQAYVSDGEYYYYKVNKFTRSWLEKQPFDYIVRLN